jgi:hypothetical protein
MYSVRGMVEYGFFKTRLNTRVSTGTVARSVNYCYVPVRFGFNRGCLCLEPGLMLRLPFRSRTMRITGTSKTKTGTRRHHSPPVPLCLAGMGGRVLVLPPKLECTFFFTPNKNESTPNKGHHVCFEMTRFVVEANPRRKGRRRHPHLRNGHAQRKITQSRKRLEF